MATTGPVNGESIPDAGVYRVVERLREATLDGALAADIADAVKGRVAARRKDILTERQKLPPEIASLSAEARRIVDTMAGMTGTARRLVDERLQQVGDQLARHVAFTGSGLRIYAVADSGRFVAMDAAADTLCRVSTTAQGALVTEPWVSVDDVAAHLGVAKDSVYRWIESKRMPAHKIGKLWKFKLSEVDEWVRGGGANQQPAKGLASVRRGKPGRKR